jgi:twitching motility protein PilU
MHPILGRFRVNCYRAMSVSGAVLRRVKTEVPTLESLELPAVLGGLALERQGLTLLVGATGSGSPPRPPRCCTTASSSLTGTS